VKTKSPTVATLQAQLGGAHARIRDLEIEVARLKRKIMEHNRLISEWVPREIIENGFHTRGES